MASRMLLRVASSTRYLALRTRPSLQWRCLSATPAWRNRVQSSSNVRISLPVSWQSLRGFSSGGSTLTVADLEERAQGVLKLFDKVDPNKVLNN